MSRIKTGILILSCVIISIQFMQPVRNESRQVLATDITKIYAVPENVKAVLRASCNDCHSNSTHYPWYANIQPFGWWLAAHIKKGKTDLNFNEFGDYTDRRQRSKLTSIANSIKDETMPLPAYTLVHANAKLSEEDKTLLLNWIKITKDSLSLKIKR